MHIYPKVPRAEMGKGEVIKKIKSYPLSKNTLLTTSRSYSKEFIRGVTTVSAYFT